MSTIEDIRRLADEARTRIKEVSPAEALDKVSAGAILIDVREEKEFQAGNILGSILISRGVLDKRIAAAVPDVATPIVLYCAVGHRSAIAADTLQKLGYQNVVSMAGGLKSYLSNTSERKTA
jgi:rhodanese-related sulfurtransferase